MLSSRALVTMRWASGLGLLLLLSARGQVWPWLVSEKHAAQAADRAAALPAEPGHEGSRPARRPPLAVLTALPDASPQRSLLPGNLATGERSASVERGPHAAGSPDASSGQNPVAFDEPPAAAPWSGRPAPLVSAGPSDAPPILPFALGTSIIAQAPPAAHA